MPHCPSSSCLSLLAAAVCLTFLYRGQFMAAPCYQNGQHFRATATARDTGVDCSVPNSACPCRQRRRNGRVEVPGEDIHSATRPLLQLHQRDVPTAILGQLASLQAVSLRASHRNRRGRAGKTASLSWKRASLISWRHAQPVALGLYLSTGIMAHFFCMFTCGIYGVARLLLTM